VSEPKWEKALRELKASKSPANSGVCEAIQLSTSYAAAQASSRGARTPLPQRQVAARGIPEPMYLSEFALIWTALMLAWTLIRTTCASFGRRGAKARPIRPACLGCSRAIYACHGPRHGAYAASRRVVLVERVERVCRVKEILCARMPPHLVQVLGFLA
jgi:hypothetical protein